MKSLLFQVNEKSQNNRITIRDQIEILCREVENLKPSKRLLFLLYFRYGHTQAEIAALLKIHPTCVSRRLKRIANALEKQLKKGISYDN